jgi:hypothetical protein
MPGRARHGVVHDRGDEESVGMRMTVAMIPGALFIMAGRLGLDRGKVTQRGIDVRADHMCPQVQQRRHGHDHPSQTTSASCGHAWRLPPK